MVFIENTYYDGIDESEYQASLTSSTATGVLTTTNSLDRFSFMVQKSL